MVNSREYKLCFPAEYIDMYGDGGLHPIHINDKFQNKRYEIMNKIGSGAYATVWAARDHHKNIDVAVKVIQARHSKDNIELRILQYIKQDTTQHPGLKYLAQLYDYFYESNPDFPESKSLFLVLELLGSTLREVRMQRRPTYFSHSLQRQFSRQLLLAVDYLHSHGIAHGDIYYSNVLFRLPDDNGLDLSEMKVRKGEITRKDGGPLEKGLPRYQVESLYFPGIIYPETYWEVTEIQLIDFSSSFFESQPPEQLVTPALFSPPESIFQKPLSKKVDIWGLANTIYYLALGDYLFETLNPRELIYQMHKTIGKSSAQWLLTALIEAIADGKWEKLPKFAYYDECIPLREDIQLSYLRDRLSDKKSHCLSKAEAHKLLDDFAQKAHVVDPIQRPMIQELPNGHIMSDAEEEHLKLLEDFLRKALVVDPIQRPTIKELEAEEWVRVEEYIEKEEIELETKEEEDTEEEDTEEEDTEEEDTEEEDTEEEDTEEEDTEEEDTEEEDMEEEDTEEEDTEEEDMEEEDTEEEDTEEEDTEEEDREEEDMGDEAKEEEEREGERKEGKKAGISLNAPVL